MRRYLAASATIALWGCSSSPANSGGMTEGEDAATSPSEASVPEAASTAPDSTTSGTHDAGGGDGEAPDDSGTDGAASDSAATDASTSDAACPSSWFVAPAVDPTIAVPDGGGMVLLHAAGAGTQNYTCNESTVDGGATYTWTFVGPEADLSDCNATLIGHHFASDAGANAPEWQTTDGTYVIGSKLAAFTPDGGASSVPWLLLQGVGHGGSGTLSSAHYIQRVQTDGGVAPAATSCNADAGGTTMKVPYTASYYFFGP
jgi:hypothetical protein